MHEGVGRKINELPFVDQGLLTGAQSLSAKLSALLANTRVVFSYRNNTVQALNLVYCSPSSSSMLFTEYL